MKKYLPKVVGSIVAAFGLLTFYLSSAIILDLFGVRADQGNYVLFVVWANLISSLLYFTASFGFFTNKEWTAKALGVSVIILVITFIGFNFHVNSGGIHEEKTMGAIIFRTVLTLVFTFLAYFPISKIRDINAV